MSFKTCSMCREVWTTPEVFLRGLSLLPIGLIVDFENPYQSLFMFNHSCGTTLAIEASSFRDHFPLLVGESLARTPGCPLHCVDIHDLESCNQPCRNAELREFLAAMRRARDGVD